jgi:glycosyltransferase involved in cell wall biosynthesis
VTGSYLLDASMKVCPDIRDKTTIIPFGVDLPKRVAPEPPDSPFRICYLKLHHAYYGPDTLIKAIDLVRETRPDIRLTMAGEGNLTEQLKAMVQERNLGDIVTFPGFVDNSTVYDVIGQHHLMVMPSLKEGFGVAALEAGACSRPVVASRVGGIPEVLQDGVTGLLIPPGDERALAGAILRLANDPGLRLRMGEAARERVQTVFDWERSLDAMSELYERMVRENRKS